MPKISVVMPVYNGEKYLAKAIESVLKQTYSDFEFIIISEYGNNEESKNIMNRYLNVDSRIKIIENQSRLGIAASLNRGLDSAVGEYIIRMDADDICVPERFQWQVEYMNNNPDISISGAEIKYIDENGNFMEGSDHFPQDSEMIKCGLLFYCYLRHPTIIMRREDMDNKKLRYNEEFEATEDFELWNRACHMVKLGNMPKIVLYYRWYAGNATHNNEKGIINYLLVMDSSFKNLGINFSEKELKYLCPITSKITMQNFKEARNVIARCEKAILEKNQKIQLYKPKALIRTLDKRIYWRKNPLRPYIAITLRLIAMYLEKFKIKTKLVYSAANYVEINGFFKSLRYTLSRIHNRS